MIELKVVISILIIHWIADFVFQSEKWALGKSKNIQDLLCHTFMYSIFWSWMALFLPEPSVYKFMIITFSVHTTTDYFTSKIVAKRFADKYQGGPIPNFGAYSMIGFDQLLHYIQLFSTYILLS